jgi:hypothetical protein
MTARFSQRKSSTSRCSPAPGSDRVLPTRVAEVQRARILAAAAGIATELDGRGSDPNNREIADHAGMTFEEALSRVPSRDGCCSAGRRGPFPNLGPRRSLNRAERRFASEHQRRRVGAPVLTPLPNNQPNHPPETWAPGFRHNERPASSTTGAVTPRVLKVFWGIIGLGEGWVDDEKDSQTCFPSES